MSRIDVASGDATRFDTPDQARTKFEHQSLTEEIKNSCGNWVASMFVSRFDNYEDLSVFTTSDSPSCSPLINQCR